MDAHLKMLEAAKAVLGDTGIITDPARMHHYTISMRHRHARPAPYVLLPENTEQVAALVRLGQQHGVALVPQGGNTGLVDGGLPNEGGKEVIINLSRMNRVRDVDVIGLVATVEAGVVLQKLHEMLNEKNLMFPLSIASEGSAEIGGLISANAGGLAALRYGTMRNLVLGVEAVLPNGEVISALRKLPKDNTGYHLSSLLIGAEGTLGIVTAATLRLLPVLQHRVTSVVALPSAKAAMDVLVALRSAAHENVTAFEFMSLVALQLVMKNVHGARFPSSVVDAPYYALIELGASSPLVPLASILESVLSPALEQGSVLDAAIAESVAQANQFWHLREHIPEGLRQEKQRLHFDIAVPVDRLADFLDSAARKVKALAPTMVLMPFGHIGDGNVHYNMYLPEPMPSETFAALKTEIQKTVFTEVEAHAGTISAEHGVGVERKAIMAQLKSPTELGIMRALKRTFDPNGIMNPGKIFD